MLARRGACGLDHPVLSLRERGMGGAAGRSDKTQATV